VTEQVAQPSAQEEEPAEREQVGVHHPGQGGLREAEILADGRERDVHDRRVEHDHDVRQAEQVQREPAFPCVERHEPPQRARPTGIPAGRTSNEGGFWSSEF
jgi:hypothetical protein